jgi:20S proteasome alpha/beta subunit
MTVLVGIHCSDGVVIAADSAATFSGSSGPTINHPVHKIDIISEKIIVAGTGSVGLGQRFASCIKGTFDRNEFKGNSEIDWARQMCEIGVRDFQQTNAPKGQFGALVGFVRRGSAHLCEFALSDFQPELKNDKCWYVSMGCGQSLADPYLALMRMAFWQHGPPTVDDAVFAATWVMHHAIELSPGFVREPIDIAVLTASNNKARLLPEAEIDEHKNNVEASIEHLRSFRTKLVNQEDALPIPEL